MENDQETPAVEVEEPQTAEETTEVPEAQENPAEEPEETFDRPYVEKLRKEAGDARVKAKDRDALAQRLHTSLVAQTGRLADPTDLAFDEEHLTDPEALAAAVDELLARKPHLASRVPTGSVGQGASKQTAEVSLLGLLQEGA